MRVLDRNGAEIVVGSRVTGSRGEGVVSKLYIAGACPTVRIYRGEAHPIAYLPAIDVNDPAGVYRCPDLELIPTGGTHHA